MLIVLPGVCDIMRDNGLALCRIDFLLADHGGYWSDSDGERIPHGSGLSMLIYGLAGGINSAAVGSYTIEVLPRHKYGEGMGLQRTISDIGYVVGPVFAGVAADLSGHGNAGGIVATLVMVGLVTTFFLFASAGGQAGRPLQKNDRAS